MIGFCLGNISEDALYSRDGNEYQNDIQIFVLRYSNVLINDHFP